MTSSELLTGDPAFFEQYVEKVKKVDKGQVVELASKFLKKDNSTTVFLIPSFAPGIYYGGKSKDLNFDLEFRSQIEISYFLKNDMKIGLNFNHISNASLGKPNVGVESLGITFVFPL